MAESPEIPHAPYPAVPRLGTDPVATWEITTRKAIRCNLSVTVKVQEQPSAHLVNETLIHSHSRTLHDCGKKMKNNKRMRMLSALTDTGHSGGL